MCSRGGWFRCNVDEKLEVLFELGDYIGSVDRQVKVEYRFDNGPIVQSTFGLGTKGMAIFAPKDELHSLISGLKISNTIRVRAFDYQGTPHDLDLPLVNSSEPIGKIQKACIG